MPNVCGVSKTEAGAWQERKARRHRERHCCARWLLPMDRKTREGVLLVECARPPIFIAAQESQNAAHRACVPDLHVTAPRGGAIQLRLDHHAQQKTTASLGFDGVTYRYREGPPALPPAFPHSRRTQQHSRKPLPFITRSPHHLLHFVINNTLIRHCAPSITVPLQRLVGIWCLA